MQQIIESGGFETNTKSAKKKKGKHKKELKNKHDMFNAISFEVVNSKGSVYERLKFR